MDFLFRIAILALGYFYPAYKCFKLIDYGKPKSEQLHLWCQYWIIIAVFTGCERVADTFISWLPFYSGAKLAFVVYLWHPDTKGTEYVYQTFLKPLVSKHTESVDFNLGHLRDETARALIVFWTSLMHQLQSRASEMLHQSVVESPCVASRPVQDNVSVYPPVTPSVYSWSNMQQDNVPVYPPVPPSVYSWSNMQQQTQPFYRGHQHLVTQSAIWPDEGHKQELLSASHLRPLPKGQQNQLRKSLNHDAMISYPDSKVQDSGAFMAATGPPSTGEYKAIGADKEETDFEVVHSNEVPKPGSDGAGTLHKSNVSGHGVRFKWWW